MQDPWFMLQNIVLSNYTTIGHGISTIIIIIEQWTHTNNRYNK